MSKDLSKHSSYETLKQMINKENSNLQDYKLANSMQYNHSGFYPVGVTPSQQFFQQPQFSTTPSNNYVYYPYSYAHYPDQYYSGYNVMDSQKSTVSFSTSKKSKKLEVRENQVKKKSIRLEQSAITNESSDSGEDDSDDTLKFSDKETKKQQSKKYHDKIDNKIDNKSCNKYTLSIHKPESTNTTKKKTSNKSNRTNKTVANSKIPEETQKFLAKCRLSYLTIQKGSKKLQNRLDCIETKEEISLIFEEIKEIGLLEVSSSQYGNYFLQKLISRLSYQEIFDFWEFAKSKKYQFWFHEFANRIMIALISKLAEFKMQNEIIEFVNPIIESLAFNRFSMFSLVTIIEDPLIVDKGELPRFIEDNFFSLCFHNAGTILLKKYMIYLLKSDYTKEKIKSFTEKHICTHISMLSTVKNSHYLVLWTVKERISNVVECVRKIKNSIESNDCSKEILIEIESISKEEKMD